MYRSSNNRHSLLKLLRSSPSEDIGICGLANKFPCHLPSAMPRQCLHHQKSTLAFRPPVRTLYPMLLADIHVM